MFLAAAVAAATFTIDDYATVRSIATPRFSPDGTRIAYVVTRASMARGVYDSDVWIVGADGSGDTQLTRGSGADNDPKWSPDGTRVGFLSDRDGKTALFVIDVRGGEAEKITKEAGAVSTFAWSPDGKSIAFVASDAKSNEREDFHVVGESTSHRHLYLAELGGETRQLTRGDSSVLSIDWHPSGKRIAFERANSIGLDDYYASDLYSVDLDGKVAPLFVAVGPEHRPRYSPDGTKLAFTSGGGVRDWLGEQGLWVADADGSNPRLVSKDYGRSFDDPFHWTADSRSLIFAGPWNMSAQLFRVNADGSGFRNLSNFDGVITEPDVHGDDVVFVRQSLTEPAELYIGTRRLTHHNDEYRSRALGETRVIRWRNPADGLEIEGLLTLPVGYTPGTRVPLLTFMHGGPASRFDEGFIGYLGFLYPVHVFAAQGFAVLRPNPRGTGGYGQSFRAANRFDWGGMDWCDVNAGIDKVIADGIADPNRLGLMGWSYGGFMATWALGHSDRFRAISIGAPVVDLPSFHRTTDIREFIPSYFPGASAEQLRAHSPLHFLKVTKVPLLIQHGEADERVPLSQSTMLYRELDDLRANVTFVTYPRAPHVPRELKQRMDVMRRNVEFFLQHVREPGREADR
jgi:dipeptidyl aminopeptidase/acylaminoacyl peptidase